MGNIYIGTSGFAFSHWEKGAFYPLDLPQTQQLEYYSKHFSSVELNYPFYRLPSAENFQNWAKQVPPGFIFTVKVSRYITHRRLLNEIQKNWPVFFDKAEKLGKKLGPFLFQFPARFKKNLQRLEEFFFYLTEEYPEYYYALEFRHPSWFEPDAIELFRKQTLNFAVVMADSPKWPSIKENYGNFIYFRLHGSRQLYSSKYSDQELLQLAKRIKIFQKHNLNVYVYFNNDVNTYAVENAKTLISFLK